MTKTVANLLHIKSRFLRSIHLERDFADPDSCKSYISTSFAKSCLKCLAEGLAPGSTRRAWRLTGDYGTGKSSFALVLTHLFSGQQDRLPKNLQKSINSKTLGFQNPRLVPILITGNRVPLRLALQSALGKALVGTGYDISNTKLPPELRQVIDTLDGEIPGIGDEKIVNALIRYSELIKEKSKGSGVLLILDELGKFLEFAAMYPEHQDIYLLQQLAEAAERSGETPFFVLGLLHQRV